MCIEPLRAEEASHNINTSRAAFLFDNKQYKSFMNELQRIARPATREPEWRETTPILPQHEQWYIDNDIPYTIIEDG